MVQSYCACDGYDRHAVKESTPASYTPPDGLTKNETVLYISLLKLKKKSPGKGIPASVIGFPID